MTRGSWEAVSFFPLRNIKFYGFGCFGSYSKVDDAKYVVKWAIDDVMSDEYTVEAVKDENYDTDKNWFTIRLKDFGLRPIKVAQDTKIDIMIYCDCDDDNYEYR